MSRRQRTLALFAILAVALALRAAHWSAVRSDPFFKHLALDSQEYDRWAREIAAGDWRGSTVFFQAPLYPYFLAVLYAAFGRNLDVVYWTQILLAVCGCWALYQAGRRFCDAWLGLLAAGLAATYPVFLFHDVQVLKTSLAVTLVSFLLWAVAVAWRREEATPWLAVGAICGVLSLLRENFLLVVPFFLAATWIRGWRSGVGIHLRRGTGLMVGLALVLLPVAIRNAHLGGSFLPTTFQGGVNFYIGNNPNADGTYQPLVEGKQIPFYERKESVRLAEEAVGHALTPSEVSRYWLGRSLAWARESPWDFVALQWRKLGMFWSWYEWPDAVDYYYVRRLSPAMSLPWLDFGGLTMLAAASLWWLRRRWVGFLPVLVFLLAVVSSTVVFFLFSRYRLPTVPGLMLLAALPLRALWLAIRQRHRRRAMTLSLLVAAALLVPRLADFEPRMDLVHFNLGRIARERGQIDVAAAHYESALKHDPESFSATFELGNLAAQARRWDRALASFQRAVSLEPTSDDAHANLGGVLIQIGRLEEARTTLDKALELNPRNTFALRNAALLYNSLGDRQRAEDLERRLQEALAEHPLATEPPGYR